LWKLKFARADEWLDQRPAARHLEQPELAQIVVDSLFHFAGIRYDLLAYCIMPSHYHWVFRPIDAWIASIEPGKKVQTARQRIQHSVNRYSGGKCNQYLEQKNRFWQPESYDHWIRDLDEFDRIVAYVEMNPVKAKLVSRPDQWLFSSAAYRASRGIERGVPLVWKIAQ